MIAHSFSGDKQRSRDRLGRMASQQELRYFVLAYGENGGAKVLVCMLQAVVDHGLMSSRRRERGIDASHGLTGYRPAGVEPFAVTPRETGGARPANYRHVGAGLRIHSHQQAKFIPYIQAPIVSRKIFAAPETVGRQVAQAIATVGAPVKKVGVERVKQIWTILVAC